MQMSSLSSRGVFRLLPPSSFGILEGGESQLGCTFCGVAAVGGLGRMLSLIFLLFDVPGNRF
jgi:hypothetical protein